MKKEYIMRLIIILLLFSISLTGCISPTINIPKISETGIPKKTSTSITTLSIIPTVTQTLTQIPSQTPTTTQIPTWTPLPTLEPTEALSYVENLLQYNAGCRLPCWWGITPGKTTWMEAQQFLESFTLLLGITGNPNNSGYASFKIPYPEDMGSISYEFGFKNGILEDIFNIYFNDLTTSYNLNEILNNYGQPDDILVSAYYEPRYSDYMINLAFIYLQKGMLLEYYDSGSRIIGDKKQVCPQKATYPHIALWSPELKITLEQASKRYLDTKNWPTYQSLQEVTGMDVETFYNTFKNSKNTSCLELTTSDWPKY